MPKDLFPNNPNNRRVILVMDDHEIDRWKYEKGGSDLLDSRDAFVLPVSQREDMPDIIRNRAIPGSILIQNPYDMENYVEATSAPQHFAHEKYMYLSTLCMHLGAKEVVIEQIELHTQAGKTSVNFEGGKQGVFKGDARLDKEELEKFSSSMHLHDEFPGGEADIEAAEQLLRRTGLWADTNMKTLVEMRRGGSNQIKSRKLTLNLSSEAKSNLKVAANIKASLVRVSTNYETDININQEYRLKFTVNF